MDKTEIIKRLKNIAKHAVHTIGEEPFIMSLDDGIAIHEAIELLEKQEPLTNNEQAIDYLRKTGWLQNHDRILTESKIMSSVQSKHGHWIRDYHVYYCSECKKYAHKDYNKWDVFSSGEWVLSDFCPNCGADMRGEIYVTN